MLSKVKLNSNSKGFSLLEIVITLGLFIIIILITGALYSLAQRSYSSAEHEMELVQNARVAYDRMSREIRQSVEIATPLSVDQASSTNEIMFQNGHNSDSINYIHYYLDGTDLRRARIIYYFEAEPDTHVRFSSTDQDGNYPDQEILEDRVVAEYFDTLKFWGGVGLVNIYSDLEKHNIVFSLRTSVFSRNY